MIAGLPEGNKADMLRDLDESAERRNKNLESIFQKAAGHVGDDPAAQERLRHMVAFMKKAGM